MLSDMSDAPVTIDAYEFTAEADFPRRVLAKFCDTQGRVYPYPLQHRAAHELSEHILLHRAEPFAMPDGTRFVFSDADTAKRAADDAMRALANAVRGGVRATSGDEAT